MSAGGTAPAYGLDSPTRLAALALTGATAAPDVTFDAFARMVRQLLDVPIALVSLVDDHRQCLVGASGLAEPLAQERQTPLSHSFCQHVVRTGRPLIVADALADPDLRSNGAVADLGVIAYAGMPLTTKDGQVLGSLAAIDKQSRLWSEAELTILRELAAACSTELRLRAETRRLQAERDTSERLRSELAARNGHLTVVSSLAAAVARTLDFATVAQTVRDHAAAAFGGWAAVRATDGDLLDSEVPSCDEDVDPSSRKVPRERIVRAEITGRIVSGHLAVAPPTGSLGEDAIARLLTDMCTTAALALDNAALLARHRQAAETLQRHLLSDVPQFEGTVLAASYQAASDEAAIGGDWYDAFRHPDGSYWLVIGDVMGHDVHAAGTMARLQHFVRAVALDGDRTPHEVLERIDALLEHHGADVYATCIAMRVLPDADPARPPGWTVEWSNAGHLPPISRNDVEATPLAAGSDLLLGVGRPRRRTQAISVPPGTQLLLFTDGLVERRSRAVDEGTAELCQVVSRARGAAPIEVCSAVIEAMIDHRSEDDVAIIVIELQHPPGITEGDAQHASIHCM